MFQYIIQKHEQDSNIFQLISSHKWRKVLKFVSEHKERISENHCICVDEVCQLEQNILHYACRFHPPLNIIQCLHQFNPKVIRREDCKGNYALHVACAHGCSPSVIQYLVKQYPLAAGKINTEDQNPFLLACKTYLQNNRNKSKKTGNKDLLKVLKTLGAAAPMSFIVQDCEGMDPLDYIIEADVDLMVLRYIQYNSINLRREIFENNTRSVQHPGTN